MKNLIISSTEEEAGKTTIGLAIAMSEPERYSYFKPFGDRPIYKKKRLIDYDAKLFKNILNLEEEYETFCLGFDHSKIRYAYDKETIKEIIKQRVQELSGGNRSVIIETGQDWRFGASISLDPVSLYDITKAEIILVVPGSRTNIVDDLTASTRYFEALDIPIKGAILNKVDSVEDIENFALPDIEKLGIDVLGIVPYIDELDLTRVSFVNDMLFGKVLAGEDGLDNIVEHVFVGALSVQEMVRNPLFHKERKLMVTGGDRSDVILASLDENTSGIVLTNDIIPPSNIISKADRAGIPLMVVPLDTYEASKRIESMDTITTIEDDYKIDRIKELISPRIRL